MLKKGFILIYTILALLITYIISNNYGPVVVRYETKLYQKITGKRGQYIQSDSTGVPVIVYQGEAGKQYNAVTVAEQAIKWAGINGDSVIERNFKNSIGWLVKNAVRLNDSSIIYYDRYDWPSYQMKAPWRSGMNQGRAIQAFLKAFERTGDTTYLVYARQAMNTLYTEVINGGVTYITNAGYWYEEYADDNVPESRVLNGMIVVLQALSDFIDKTGDYSAKFLFSKGIDAVENSLPFYDTNGHSNYDILGKPASAWYHKFHTEQLEFLYNKTRIPIFNEYKEKWIQYREPSFLCALFRKPTNIGLFSVFTVFCTVAVILLIIHCFCYSLIKRREISRTDI